MLRMSVAGWQRQAVCLGLLALSAGCKQTPPEPQNAAQAEPVTAAVSTPAPVPTPPPSATAESAVSGEGALALGGAAPSASSAPAPSASAAASAAPSAQKPVPIPAGHHKVVAKPTQPIKPSPDDPLKGVFTLADATQGLPAKGKLIADMKTDAGKLECELYDDRAPITVANFIGLVRGLRPFKDPVRAMGEEACLRRPHVPSHHQGLHDPGRRPAGNRCG
ncbi:MAG: peptidylprolyl isomerase [Polyangiaceae bacterium]